MRHIDFVGQSPWPLFALAIAVTIVYIVTKRLIRKCEERQDVPPRPNPPRDRYIAGFNDWQQKLAKERKKMYKGRAK